MALALGVAAASAVAQDAVGQLAASRAATYSATPTAANPNYGPAKSGQAVKNGDGVRTARRGFAQIAFRDKSVLRLAELTELIVQDSVALRRLQLAKGALWVRVTKGSNTAIQTPVATATVRGTELLIDEKGNLAVREGVVELEAGGFTIEVHAGEVAGVGPDGKPYKKGIRMPTEDTGDPYDLGIPELWWTRLRGESDPSRHEDWAPALLLLPFLVPRDRDRRERHSAVPEPATVATLVVGVGWMAARKRRRS